MIMPDLEPFSKETLEVYNSYRVTAAEWPYLGYTLGYSLLLTVFFYLLADYVLKRKRHI
jgi:hypothetical protein